MEWLAVAYALALVGVIAVVPITLARRWRHQRAHRGLDAFRDVDAPTVRRLKVEPVRLTWLSHEMKSVREATLASIRHTARLPYVVQFESGRVSCYDKHGYEEWTAGGGDPRCVPLPVQQLCELGLLERLRGVEGLADIRGVVAIEPHRVTALEEQGQVDPAYARRLVHVMLKLAEEAERPLVGKVAQAAQPA